MSAIILYDLARSHNEELARDAGRELMARQVPWLGNQTPRWSAHHVFSAVAAWLSGPATARAV